MKWSICVLRRIRHSSLPDYSHIRTDPLEENKRMLIGYFTMANNIRTPDTVILIPTRTATSTEEATDIMDRIMARRCRYPKVKRMNFYTTSQQAPKCEQDRQLSASDRKC